MKLLILTPEYTSSGGGIASYYQCLVSALSRTDVEIHVVEGSALHSSESPSPRRLNGATVETLESRRIDEWSSRFTALAELPALRRHIAASWAMWEQSDFGAGADIVEACDWGLCFVPPAVEGMKPLIIQCHGSIGQISVHDPIAGEEVQGIVTRLLERAVLSGATNVQASTRTNAEFWRGEGALNLSVMRPARATSPVSSEPNLQNSGRGIVVGRVQRWKGPQVVCAALRFLGSRAPEIDWFGRDVPWQNRETSSVAHLAGAFPEIWGKKLIRHTPISQAEASQRQTAALFNLIPSTWDVFNFTVIEAMASGRPAIVSNGAGASELIDGGVNGFLFPAGDAEALAATIERVMGESPARLAEIGMAAQETIRVSLDPDKIAAERVAAYHDAINNFKRNPPAPVGGSWLGDICRPSAQDALRDMAFLDHHPLRSILAHSGRRLSRRLWPKMA